MPRAFFSLSKTGSAAFARFQKKACGNAPLSARVFRRLLCRSHQPSCKRQGAKYAEQFGTPQRSLRSWLVPDEHLQRLHCQELLTLAIEAVTQSMTI